VQPLLQMTDAGLFCPVGDFHLDPWRPVPRAVVTHAHADHARPGSGRYLAARPGEVVLRVRIGADALVDTLPYGEAVTHNGVRISFHPAGHILGSAQVRLEHQGHVVVCSGDYKLHADPTTTPWEPVRCDVFLTESTFGLPIYRWPADPFPEIDAWWRGNQAAGKASILYGYALGKAQRLIAGVDPSIGPIYVHGAVDRFMQAYRDSGVSLPPTTPVAAADKKTTDWSRALIVAPPSAHGTPWMRTFGRASTAFASGWMRIRGTRRRRAVDRGFVVSDHVDWPDLLRAIDATGARTIWVTHGNVAVVVRYLREKGFEAEGIATRYSDEEEAATEANE
jgi:putative mRNA 3-end processing factor